MGKLFWRVVPLCVVVAVIGAAFAATGANALNKKCHLFPEMTRIQGSFGAGNVGYLLRLKNPEAWSCKVGRHPVLQLLDENGDPLPTNRVKVGAQGTVVIPAGRGVNATLRFSPDTPGPGEPSQGPCEPKAVKIRVHTPWGTARRGSSPRPRSATTAGSRRGR